MSSTSIKHDNYTSEDIQVLEGLEAVRKRPGMYIGTTSSTGLHHLVWEIIDNSIDEALAGYATHIEVSVDDEDVVTVSRDGYTFEGWSVSSTGANNWKSSIAKNADGFSAGRYGNVVLTAMWSKTLSVSYRFTWNTIDDPRPKTIPTTEH